MKFNSLNYYYKKHGNLLVASAPDAGFKSMLLILISLSSFWLDLISWISLKDSSSKSGKSDLVSSLEFGFNFSAKKKLELNLQVSLNVITLDKFRLSHF
jgi:hypothetical protein